ncbi:MULTISPECIES: MCE family protein [Mycobacteriaceae]|uniref:MCE family protein n=1 Tax=Mycolicibacterium mucogenicum DSM 44124 TaxID=1226753 RepID=A0A8H2JE96_MYCMU|nr:MULTISPECIES: MCE family protein [Mycobacteriaceae]KAB7760282.1 mammalian cell entry protein [Mycolicibacterium mucogenicum DSM 44124]QPG67763.1 MCE family protein [Mycolicibacterium mucogenicum DSM 44124]SEA27304.1 virulence factor Mce family protein [Mycobacterium sp. 283mftsu]
MSKRALMIGAIAVIAIVALVTTAAAVAPRMWHRNITVTAHFQDAVGLYPGNAVSVLGMQVGKVDSVVNKGGYIEVTMDIDKKVPIPSDVTAATVSASILTDRHVELTPPYRGGNKLRDGDLIALGHTRTPVEFDKTLSMIDKLGTALKGNPQGGGPLGDLVDLGSRISSENSTQIKSTLTKLSEALKVGPDGGAKTEKNLQEIIRSVSDLTQSAAENDDAIRKFGGNVHQLSDILADQNLGSGRTGAKANEILEEVSGLLERHRDQLKGSFGDLNTVVRSLSDNKRELEETLDVLPLTLDNVYNVLDPVGGSIRGHLVTDKLLAYNQLNKELCNLMGLKQLGCATGTLQDYGPDFGLTSMMDLMANGIGPSGQGEPPKPGAAAATPSPAPAAPAPGGPTR